MNTPMEIPQTELIDFKEKVKHWLALDIQISEMETKIRELKKLRNSAQQAKEEIKECLIDLPLSQQQLSTKI